MAALVSPIEAVRYTDKEHSGKKSSGTLQKPLRYIRWHLQILDAIKNVRCWLFLVSLSIILLNTVVTLSNGIDMNKIVLRHVDTDFLLAHSNYFQYKYSGIENGTTEQMIQTIQGIDGFQEGGRLYYGRSEAFTVADPNLPKDYSGSVDQHNNPFASVYGLDPLPLSR